MADDKSLPWATGPGEILQHGLTLLHQDTETSRRLAMLSIDNAVELSMRTYLGLPRRISGLAITRKEYQEISESFPDLLDALEKHAPQSVLEGIDLGEIEWFHRLRNELYHQGNGLTVEKYKVEVYSELARLLYNRLFGQELELKSDKHTEALGKFLTSWFEVDSVIASIREELRMNQDSTRTSLATLHYLYHQKRIGDDLMARYTKLNSIRNELVHGKRMEVDVKVFTQLDRIIDDFKELLVTFQNK
jgi:hypothetical protein